MGIVKIKDKTFKTSIPEADILKKVQVVADRLNQDYAGKEFKVCYQTNGYYDIVPDKLGFKIQYVSFETCVSRSFIDEFFGEWLDNPIAYGAFASCIPSFEHAASVTS